MYLNTGSSTFIPLQFVITASVADCKEMSKQALAEFGWTHIREHGNKVFGAPSAGFRLFGIIGSALAFRTADEVTFEFNTLPDSQILASLHFKSHLKKQKANESLTKLVSILHKVAAHFGKSLNFEHPDARFLRQTMARVYPDLFSSE